MTDYEKLGVFYLGKTMDPAQGTRTDDLLLYDAKDLTTHGVCVGMTGSGKTGLCLSLIEEAALDNIPVLAVDPKGDLGNLLLTFPDLLASDFQPWVDPAEAARKGMDPAAYAAKTAESWKNGLAEWHMDADRIRRLKAAAEFAIHTPGSNAGLPLSLLRSFAPPPPEVMTDGEALRDRISSTVSGLLSLIGIHADPLRSREHILLGNILATAWAKNEELDLAALITAIQKPPFTRVGVMDLEAFFPAGDRLALAMNLNNLLASPGFSAWMEGDPLDIQRLLWTPEGKARVCILSISHLSDAERMFFVTMLLNEVVAWMRRQSGTSSLRALLYMDEIYGFFPPVAEPPSKKPMLLLLKQARAFGLGVLLATQNPVDLDYKGLGNTGTWFIGLLQTDQDKQRMLDGLESAAFQNPKGFNRSEMDRMISSLEKRQFILNNVHDNGPPVKFMTRWCLSYLRGPLTRPQIAQLMAPRKGGATASAPPPLPSTAAAGPSKLRPVAPEGVREAFLPPDLPIPGAPRTYTPMARAVVTLHYADAKSGIDAWRNLTLLAPFSPETPDPAWDTRLAFETAGFRPAATPDEPATWLPLPPTAAKPASYRTWEKQVESWLYQNMPLEVFRCTELKLVSQPGEREGDFRARLAHAAREIRDVEAEAIRRKYAPKLAVMQDRLRRAETRVEKEKAQYSQQKVGSMVSIGSAILGAFLGRGRGLSATNLGRAGSAFSKVGRTAAERADVQRAEEEIGLTQEKAEALQAEMNAEVESLTARYHPESLAVETVRILPRKGDMVVNELGLAWKAV